MREAWFCCLLVGLVSLSWTALAQEPEESVEEEAAATVAAEPAADAAADTDELDDLDDLDDADLDLQTYEQDDDDFVPTEEVPADQAIPFPSDI